MTIPMKRRPVNLDVDKDGIRMSSDVQAENAARWNCGDRPIPTLPHNLEYLLTYAGSTEVFRHMPATISTKV